MKMGEGWSKEENPIVMLMMTKNIQCDE